MKEFCNKLSNALRTIFGYGIMVSLFGGGLTFFGYVAAHIIGGDAAAAICAFIYKQVVPVIIYLAVIMVLLGLVSMYLKGEVSLTPEKKPTKKREGET